VDDAESKMMLDDATSTVDGVTSVMPEVTMSDDSTSPSVLVGVTTGLVALSCSDSLRVTKLDSVVETVASLAEAVISAELTVMGTEAAMSELTGVGVDSMPLDAEVTSKLGVREEKTSGNVIVDVEATSLEPSIEEETPSELTGVAEEKASVTEDDTSEDVMMAMSDDEIASGVAVITGEGVLVKVATDRVETSEEANSVRSDETVVNDDETSEVATTEEEATSEVMVVGEGATMTSVETAADDDARTDEALIDEEASEAVTADEAMTTEDKPVEEDIATAEEDTAGVGEALGGEDREALIDRVGATGEEADDLTAPEAERIEDEDLTDVDRVDVVRLEEALVEEVLAEVGGKDM
jgi:hypothetical protein